MNRNNRWKFACFAVAVILTGCASQPGEIFRNYDLDSGRSITTGSRQRVVNNTQPGRLSEPGRVVPERIVCVEPSPDVAVAVANSFGVGFSALGQGSGTLTGTEVEGVAQLAERTATIQLLRDQMFRACEAYANGAVSDTTYSLIMSRVNDTMVTLLMGENASGAFGRQLAALGGTASAEAKAALGKLEETSKSLQAAADDLKAAEDEVAAKAQALAAAEEKRDPNDPTKQTEAQVEAVGKAKGELEVARRHRDEIADRHRGEATAFSKATAEVTNITAGGSITAKPDAMTAGVLEEMQGAFLSDDGINSLIAACVVELGGQLPTSSSELNNLNDFKSDCDDNDDPRKCCDDSPECYANNHVNSAWFGRALARRWVNLSKAFEDLVKTKKTDEAQSLAETLEGARADAWAYNAGLRQSALAKHCRKKIFPFIEKFQNQKSKNRHEVAKLRVAVDKRRAEADRVANLTSLAKQCDEAKDPEVKKACIEVLKAQALGTNVAP